MSALPPLTHHDILALVEPFSRAGRTLDLAASDRVERRLVFKPTERQLPATTALPALNERLQLDHAEPGRFVLTRTASTADGLQATLVAEGADAAELLQRIDAVPLQRQFMVGAGSLAALSQRMAPSGLQLRQAEARFSGMRLRMSLSGVKGYPAELELTHVGSEGAAPQKLPDDLLAVLGRPWDRLSRTRTAWMSSVQLRGAEPQRSLDAEQRLARTVDHLARTLAEPPARFHQRHRGARWGVALRRMLPLSIGLAVVAVAVWTQQRGGPGQQSILALLANAAPPLLMIAFFMRREMPRLELPRVPLAPRASAWQPHRGH